ELGHSVLAQWVRWGDFAFPPHRETHPLWRTWMGPVAARTTAAWFFPDLPVPNLALGRRQPLLLFPVSPQVVQTIPVKSFSILLKAEVSAVAKTTPLGKFTLEARMPFLVPSLPQVQAGQLSMGSGVVILLFVSFWVDSGLFLL